MKIAVFSATLLLRSAIKNDIIFMTSRYKRLQKLLNGQGELSFSEIATVLNDFGYTLVRISGSHHLFKGIYGDTINLPVHNEKINKYYRKDIINAISKHFEI